MKKLFTAIALVALTALSACTLNTAKMQTSMPKNGDQIAVITTTEGVMSVKLFPKLAPETVKNFVELAKSGKYDGVIFHRVIKDFMIQTGDFENSNGTGGYTYKGVGTMLDDEFHKNLKNIRGALSMANRGPNTNGSQFFIVHAPDTSWLDGRHSVFGQVYDGLEVLDLIASAPTDAYDMPLEEIRIESIEIREFEE